MKKFITLLCSVFLLSGLFGCSSPEPTLELQDGVTFELTDVMTITNDETNSIFYYYMATITNDTDETYSTNNVVYKITDYGEENFNAIERHESMPITTVMSGQTAYVYGYIGFPNSNQNDMGFYFEDQDAFVSFNSVNIRKADNHDIQESEDLSFTLYEDNALSISINAEDTNVSFENGNTTLNNLIITYTNKTDRQIVVPYLEPGATLHGLLLTQYSDKGDFSNMNEEQLRDIDFTSDGLAPKTDDVDGEAYGYMVEYLDPEQSIDCNVGFTFTNAAVNYGGQTGSCFDIHLVSSAFGITHDMILGAE